MVPNERVSIAADGFFSIRAVVAVVAATLAATLGDACLELLIAAGAFGHGFVDRSHATVLPAALVGAASLLGLAAWIRAERRYEGDWIVLALRDAERFGFTRSVAAVAALALSLSCVLERVEELLGGGAPFGGVTLWGFAGVVIVALFAAAALAVVGTLGLSLRALVRAFDSVADALRACVAFVVSRRRRVDASYRARRHAGTQFAAVAIRVPGYRGERAPPRSRSSVR